MAQHLFHVSEVFSLRGRGVVVITDIPTSRTNFRLRIGDCVEIVRSDGSRTRTMVRGIELCDPYDPRRSFAFLVGQEVDKDDIELGVEVWRAQEGHPEPRSTPDSARYEK
jgi:translation elongation factor EF-Tu-like GTPase